MQKKEFEKHWNQLRISAQKHWNKLTADDLYQIDGMWDHLVQRLVKRYGYTQEIAEKEMENWQPAWEARSEWEAEGRGDERPEMDDEKQSWKELGGKKAKIQDWQMPREEGRKRQEPPTEGKQKKRKAG